MFQTEEISYCSPRKWFFIFWKANIYLALKVTLIICLYHISLEERTFRLPYRCGGCFPSVRSPLFLLLKTMNFEDSVVVQIPTQPSSSCFLGHSLCSAWAAPSHSVMSNSATPRTVAHQAPLSMGILRARVLKLPCPPPGDLPNPGIEPRSPALPAYSLPSEPQGKPKNTGVGSLSLLQGIFPTQESNQSLLHCRQILYQLSYLGNCMFCL